jgi:hypothetical protein
MGADGSIFAMRRSLYPDVPPHLLDDLTASTSPIFSGYRVVRAANVHAFEKATTTTGDEFRRKRRIACRAFNTHRHLVPKLRSMNSVNKFKYTSHKYLRWFSAVFLVLAVGFGTIGIAAVAGFSVALLILGAGVFTLVMARVLNVPILGTIAEIVMHILAVGLGIAEALAGRNYQTWNPAKSRQE